MGEKRGTEASRRAGVLACWRAGAALGVIFAMISAAMAIDAQKAGAGLSASGASTGETVKQPLVSAIATRLEQGKDKARLVFETTAEVSATAFPVAAPDRIVVELPEVAFRIDPHIGHSAGSPASRPRPGNAPDGDGLVKSYRFGLFAPGRSRIVIDLTRPARIVRVGTDSKLDETRLVIELEQSDAKSFAAEAARHAGPLSQATAQPSTPAAQPQVGEKPVVVIDPGHGGVDIGAAGAHGEQEKTIVLDFARILKTKLEAMGRFHVVMTRNEDVFMALDERVRVARQNNAALFLSIHADTLGEPSVEGATIYTVSTRASDAEAAKIAEKENFADQAAGLERKEDASDVGDILFDLTRRETRAYSRVFADTLIDRWKTAGNLNKNPNRSAGFVVLKAHDVPSVLLELGYLSSQRDLARLASAEWRERAAETTAQAIESFFSSRERQPEAPAQAVASRSRQQ